MTSEKAEEAPASASRGSRPYLVLVALFVGLVGGTFAQAGGDGIREPLIQVATYVGGLWLDALKMTVIPLIVALLVTGIAKGAEAARAGRIAGRSILWFVIVCTSSAIFGAVMMSLLVRWFPLPQGAGEALQAGLAAIDQSTSSPPIPSVADFFRGIIPSNVIAAASNGDVLPLVVFTVFFALAVAPEKKVRLGRFKRPQTRKRIGGVLNFLHRLLLSRRFGRAQRTNLKLRARSRRSSL